MILIWRDAEDLTWMFQVEYKGQTICGGDYDYEYQAHDAANKRRREMSNP